MIHHLLSRCSHDLKRLCVLKKKNSRQDITSKSKELKALLEMEDHLIQLEIKKKSTKGFGSALGPR